MAPQIRGGFMKKIILLIASLGFTACSSSGGGGGNGVVPGSELPELTSQQQSRVVAVSSELNDIDSVASSHGNSNTSNNFLMESNEAVNKTSPKGPSEKATQLKHKMDSAINFGQCNVNVKPNNMGSSADLNNQEFTMIIENSVNSNECPIYYMSSSVTKTSGDPSSSSVVETQMNMEFKANNSTDISNTLDISSYKFNMTSKVSTTMQNQTTAKMDISMLGAGSLVSKSEGNIEMTMNMAGSGLISGDSSGNSNANINMSFTVDLKFSDFTVRGYQTMTLNNKNGELAQEAKYYINGKEVTEEEFSNIFQSDFLTDATSEDGSVSSGNTNESPASF